MHRVAKNVPAEVDMRAAQMALKKLADMSGLELPGMDRAVQACEVVPLEPGAFAFRQGELHPYIHVVSSGLLKQYYTDESGNSWITRFTDAGVPFACVDALDGGRTRFSSEAIEPSIVERVHFKNVSALVAKHP